MKVSFFLVLLFVTSCSEPESEPFKRQPLLIKPLYPYVENVNVNSGYKVRLYELENFNTYDVDSVLLDQYVAKHIDVDYKNHFNYSIQFFERKAPSGSNNYKAKKEIENYDYKNPTVAYNWSRGIFRGVSYSKDGAYWIYYKNKKGIFHSLDSTASREPIKISGESTDSSK